MPTGTQTSFGRFQVAEPPSKMALFHFHRDDVALKEVDWWPKCAILDQEDLAAQGINVASFIPGAAQGVNALGSCTAQTFIEWASWALPVEEFTKLIAALLALVGLTVPVYAQGADIYSDTKTLEIAAIVFYFRCTHQTGSPAQEWPPTDCGSTGLYVFEEGQRIGAVAGEQLAHGAANIVSLMQHGPLLGGIPFLNAWMQPLASDNYCVDGDGAVNTLREQIAEGVAGGHELLFPKIAQLAVVAGQVDPLHTIIEFPNHWSRNWADQGRARIHLSTFVTLGQYCDFRRFLAA